MLSDNDEELDEDEESIHEPFAKSFAQLNDPDSVARNLEFQSTEFDSTTQEFDTAQSSVKPSVDALGQSPSILKRKRSLDVTENKPRDSLSQ